MTQTDHALGLRLAKPLKFYRFQRLGKMRFSDAVDKDR